MSIFQVNDMTCGHCAGKIRTALFDADPQATVAVDVPSRRVEVRGSRLAEAQLQQAIAGAGYTPVPLQSASPVPQAAGRGCCG